ncbi:MFS-type transporter SLC18B1-like [Lingula anatina]|uniref:MFS-type transporter SLC18B1-like n=1 Tax=Lingula anatina TaxID=7574 RepID=A0A1S3JIB2_LINAN|nr:MFS-type transporter SLC18B1-like [Lingula anatina]|eukprot:XP_013410103.1 MFS-type transporter SLC18B1-like [Lingula anatina]
MSFTSNYALATREFRDNTATAYGFLETFAGLGHVLGPLIGGSLYQLGGFGLSFFVSAPLTIITATVAFFTLPTEKDEQELSSDYGQLIKLAKIPAIPLEHLAVWVGYIGLSALSPTLGGHYESVDSSVQGNHIMIGLAFALCGIFYTCSVFLFGYITDKSNHYKLMIITGLVVTALSFTFIGPWEPLTDLFPNNKGTAWGVILGNCLSGIGCACINVAVLADCVNEAVSHGLPDNIVTYGNLSAIFDTSMGLGSFIGPFIGAAIVEHNPFSTLSAVLTGLCLGEAGLLVLYCAIVFAVFKRRQYKSGYRSIDGNNATYSDTNDAKGTLLLPPIPYPAIQKQYVQSE